MSGLESVPEEPTQEPKEGDVIHNIAEEVEPESASRDPVVERELRRLEEQAKTQVERWMSKFGLSAEALFPHIKKIAEDSNLPADEIERAIRKKMAEETN